jgi:ABC-type transport system substrate-binding protein
MAVSVTDNWIAAFPQLLNPTPAAIANVQFRRALAYAVDRQELTDTLTGGLVPPAHSYLNPTDPLYREVESGIVRYEYDSRRAAQLIEGLGYQRAADGGYRDAVGQRLAVEIRVVGGDVNQKATLAVADYWQRTGIEAQPVQVPPQRARDVEWRANFPGFEVAQQPADFTANALRRFHSTEASLPENSYRGNNRTRYQSPELDALIDRYYVTIPRGERVQVIGQIMHHMTDQAIVMGLLYNAQATMVASRLRNVPPSTTWNAHEWLVS